MTAATAEDSGLVGPYRVIQAIGAGGSARIDLARIDRAYGFQRHVVLKRPLEHLRGDPNVAASLRREARIGGRLRHPNLVTVLDAGIHDGYDYLVLEYVHGAALRAVMQGDAPGQVRDLPLGVALAIASDAARGMHEAHELADDTGAPLGLVHRDVSPGNILLGLDGTVKLADFGIAKETRVSTLSGSMHGTVTYMAPEQCQGHAFDRRADVFSLGVILYELVTGTRLFWADNDVASLHRVLSGAVPRPRQVKPQIAGALEDVVMTAVAYAPERRFATALELATAVEQYAATAGEPLGARWIARALEAVVGPRPVPWLAAAPVLAERSEETGGGDPAGSAGGAGGGAPRGIEVAPMPSGERSLVELIAASGADDPVEPGFGDAGALAVPADADADADADAAQTLALGAAVGDAAAAADPQTRPPTGLPPRPATATDAADPPVAPASPRRRRWFAVMLAAGVIGAGTAVALVMTGEADAPAAAGAAAAPPAISATAPAAATPTAPAASDPAPAAQPPRDPAPARELVEVTAGPPPGSPGEPSAGDRPPLASAPADASSARGPDRPATKRKRPASRPPREPAAGRNPRAEPVPAVAAPAAGPDRATGPERAAPPPRNVEWKPTLLLPTDGSDGRAHR
ncbi:MAG TPA: protein kinase [Kofleriaceae bacterium]|nr:protein kinase [Kofleriaceae bacterium]